MVIGQEGMTMSEAFNGILKSGLRMVLAAAILAMSPVAAAVAADSPPKQVDIDGLKSKFVDVGGIKTRYYDYGKGEVILLVHGSSWGWGNNSNTWTKNIPYFAKRFRVLAPDKLGSGLTDNPKDESQYGSQFAEADHLYQFLQTMKVDKVHLVSMSQGSPAAWIMAINHPEVVKTMILQNNGVARPYQGPTNRDDEIGKCPPRREPTAFEEWKCRMISLTYQKDAFLDDYFEASRYMKSTPARMRGDELTLQGVRAGQQPKYNAWVEELGQRMDRENVLDVPTLVYWSANDHSNGIYGGTLLFDRLSRHNPRTRMIITNKSSHFHQREWPEEYSRNVMNFIDYWNKQEKNPEPAHAAARTTPVRDIFN